MPNAIESTSDSRNGSEEGVGHPDGEDGVLLPDGLPGSDMVFCRLSDVASYGELHPAGSQCDERDTEEGGEAYIAMHDGTCGDGNGHGECHGP